jgi:hypothetical protein
MMHIGLNEAYAQQTNIKEEISKVKFRYEKSANLSYQFSTWYYTDIENLKPDLILNGETKIHGAMYKTRFDSMVYIVNRHYKFVIDDASQAIGLDTILPGKGQEAPAIDSLISAFHVKEKKQNGAYSVFTFSMDENSTVNNYELYISNNTGFIDKVIMNYNPMLDEEGEAVTPRVITLITGYSTMPISESEFSETDYFDYEEGQFYPKSSYQDYEFINQLDTEED